jgi:HPt (histidine-containing phosphotransfer) domain-containing protein
MTSLRAALQAARAGDSPAFATMEDILHRICGTGGSVGFEAMSGYANTMARLVEQGAKGSMTMDAALLGRLDELVDELDYCLQQAALMSGALT